FQDCVAVRLKPGELLRESLMQLVKEQGLSSAFVISCVGSLTQARLRYATSSDGSGTNPSELLQRHMEIVSLVGTISQGGQSCHLHICLSDEHGRAIGGHLLGDDIVYTTAEVVLGCHAGLVFTREPDPATAFDELVVTAAPALKPK
uniref:PPC domain-containing protein n=3 Tax=Macrostomum lignano TaxID=282301 RepID=A0A1I8GWC4_9PLAT